MSSTMPFMHWNWQKLFSYGEVVCFVSAWAVGLLLAMHGERPNQDHMATRAFATTSDMLGIQANLRR